MAEDRLEVGSVRSELLPLVVQAEGAEAAEAFLEFFAAHIRNKNTRRAYGKRVGDFLGYVEGHGVRLGEIRPLHVAAYIELLGERYEAQTVKQALAAIRMLFDFLQVRGVVTANPAAPVRGPKHVSDTGKTPILTKEGVRGLLESIETDTVKGLRDRALLATMLYTFARVGAVVKLRVEDYYRVEKRYFLRLKEKGGKRLTVPAHPKVEDYLDAYLAAASIGEEGKTPLFRTVDRTRTLSANGMSERDVHRMVKRRAREAGLSDTLTCHSLRGTGITLYLKNQGTLEHAQRIAGHASPRTTKLYDRRSEEIDFDEILKINLA